MVSKTVMSTFACVPFFIIVQNLIVYVGSLKPTQHVCFFIAKGMSSGINLITQFQSTQ